AGKRLELLHEVVPGLGRLAILGNVGNPLSVLELGEVRAAARALGLEVHKLEIRRGQDIAPAFEALKGHADALYVCIDGLVNTNRIRINTSALGARLPTMHGAREYVEAGGLMSYGANYADLFRRSAGIALKIGASAGRALSHRQRLRGLSLIQRISSNLNGLCLRHVLSNGKSSRRTLRCSE